MLKNQILLLDANNGDAGYIFEDSDQFESVQQNIVNITYDYTEQKYYISSDSAIIQLSGARIADESIQIQQDMQLSIDNVHYTASLRLIDTLRSDMYDTQMQQIRRDSSSLYFKYAAIADLNARNYQNDAIGYFTEVDKQLGNLRRGMWVIADGVGDRNWGVSRYACQYLLNSYSDSGRINDVQAFIRERLRSANEAILDFHEDLEQSYSDDVIRQAATTISIVIYQNQQWYFFNVGDSPIYFRPYGAQLEPRYEEHSDSEGRLQYALGKSNLETSDIFSTADRAQVGDAVLLCSDGLIAPIDDIFFQTVAQKIVEDKTPKLTLEDLLTDAKSSQKDNITAWLIRAIAEPAPLPNITDVKELQNAGQPIDNILVTPQEARRQSENKGFFQRIMGRSRGRSNE